MCAAGGGVLALPEEIPFEAGAVMMCSSATALHAWNKAELAGGRLWRFGFGGLGFSALQLARAGRGGDFRGGRAGGEIAAGGGYGRDSDPSKTGRSRGTNSPGDKRPRGGHRAGIGRRATMDQAVRSLGIFGRAALVGLSDKSFAVAPYANLINKEARIIGVSDHLASELPGLLAMAQAGRLEFPESALRAIPMDAAAINAALMSWRERKKEAGGGKKPVRFARSCGRVNGPLSGSAVISCFNLLASIFPGIVLAAGFFPFVE